MADSKLVGGKETLGRYKGVGLYVISQKCLDEIKIWWMMLVISKIWGFRIEVKIWSGSINQLGLDR